MQDRQNRQVFYMLYMFYMVKQKDIRAKFNKLGGPRSVAAGLAPSRDHEPGKGVRSCGAFGLVNRQADVIPYGHERNIDP